MDPSQYPYPVIRLTKNEFKMLKNKKAGDIFYHINLQHSGIPTIDFAYKNYFAGMIEKHGKVTKDKNTEPVLSDDYLFFLELLKIELDAPIKTLNRDLKDFILENQSGLFESLCDKYCSVRSLTPDQILSMNCFIRQFKICDSSGSRTHDCLDESQES